jgi:predicted house-cleaning noncanonical NTP pyrophosphatase (MazG superfamily)
MKLVRTGIPEVVRSRGEVEPFRQVVDDEEHDRLLDEKFDEELGEWRESHEPEELADLLAVVRDTATRVGVGWHELVWMEWEKRRRYGDFLGGVVWLGEHPQRDDYAGPIPERERIVHENTELRASLDRGMADAAAGRVRPFSELSAKLDERLRADAERDRLRCRNCGATLDACFADPPCCRTQGGKAGCLHG